MPAFLIQNARIFIYFGEEHGIQIHLHQIDKILIVRGGNGIGCPVGRGHGVDEGIQAALHQLHKGVLRRVIARAVQYRVFQDVGATGIVLGDGLESYVKYLVAVLTFQIHQFGAALLMVIAVRGDLHFLDFPALNQFKAVDYFSLFHWFVYPLYSIF
ncbi:hypothetical protein DSECCO2_555780 [anaerobic digester metagenome]